MNKPHHLLTALALGLTVALSAGCASKALKPETETVTDTQPAADEAAKDENGVKTGALGGKGGIRGEGTEAGDAEGGDGSGGSEASGAANGGRGGLGGNGADSTAAADLSVRVVRFDFDSADIRQQDYPALLAHARYLQQNPQAKVLLAGHADERGTREYNMALGERRAKAVEAFLGVNGVRGGQLESVSYGKEKPLNEGTDEAAWAENRRVELGYEAGAPKP